MGALEDLYKANPAVKAAQTGGTSSGDPFAALREANPEVGQGGTFGGGYVAQQHINTLLGEFRKQRDSAASVVSDKTDFSIAEIGGGFKRGWTETPWVKPEDLTLRERMAKTQEGGMGTIGNKVWEMSKDAWVNLDNRINEHLKPIGNYYGDPSAPAPTAAEVTNAIAMSGLEIANVVFAPFAGVIEGAAETPGLSFVGNSLRKIFGSVGGGVGETLSEVMDATPFSVETKMAVEPALQGIGGLIGQFVAGYGMGKAGARYIPELKVKITEVVDAIAKDKVVQNKIAEINAKMRGYEGYKEGEPIDWGDTPAPGRGRGAVEEVIDWGDSEISGRLKNVDNTGKPLPVIDFETGRVRPTEPVRPAVPAGTTPGTPEAPKTPAVRYVRLEKENYPGKTVQVTSEGMNESATVVSVPSPTEVVVRVQNGEQITVPSSAVRDLRTSAEIIKAAQERAATESAPSSIRMEQAPPPKPTRAGEPIEPSTTEVQAPKQEGAAPKQDIVTSGGVSYRVSGRAFTEYQTRLAEHNRRMAQLQESYQNGPTASMREQAGKQLKAEGMQWSAYVRELTGKLTYTEIKNTLKKEKSNYVGKEVLVKINGKWVKATIVSKPAYGNVKVKLKNGKEITVKTENIKDPRSDAEIKESITKREEVKEYDATAEEVKPAEEATKMAEEPVAETAKPIELSQQYNDALIELELAEKGFQFPVGDTGKWSGVASTFPEWIPKEARRKEKIDKFLKGRDGTTNDLTIKYKKGSVLDRMQKAFDEYVAKREMEAEQARPIEPSTVNGQPVTLEATPEAQAYMKPLSGSGEARNPTLVNRLAESLQGDFGELPIYQRLNFAEQAQMVIDFIARSPQEAWNVAMGRTRAPSGILETAVWKEYSLRAEASKDYDAVRTLATSPIVEATVRYGQEIGILATFSKESAVGRVLDLGKQREALWEKRNKGVKSKMAVEQDKVAMKEEIRRNSSKRQTWEEFMRDIMC